MADETTSTEEVFPKDSNKSFALVELMRRKGPMVGKGPDQTVFSFPVVLLWELILLLGVTLGIFLFSLFKQAPLGEIANPLLTTDPAKAPWYFVGLQELLEHMHPTLAGVIIPGLLIVFLVLLPFIDYSREGVGTWFSSPRGNRIVFFTGLYAVVATVAYIVVDNAFPLRELLRDSAPQWIAQGLAPLLVLTTLVVLPLIVLRVRRASRHELIMALFTFVVVAAIVLTISGFLFRGPGFKLYWPWEMPNGYNPWDEL